MQQTVLIQCKFEDPPLKIHKIYNFLDFVIDSKME